MRWHFTTRCLGLALHVLAVKQTGCGASPPWPLGQHNPQWANYVMDVAQRLPCRCQVAKYMILQMRGCPLLRFIVGGYVTICFLKGHDIPTSAYWWMQSMHQEEKGETFFGLVIFSFICTWCSNTAQFTPNIIGLAVESKEKEPRRCNLQSSVWKEVETVTVLSCRTW